MLYLTDSIKSGKTSLDLYQDTETLTTFYAHFRFLDMIVRLAAKDIDLAREEGLELHNWKMKELENGE